ncbi:MAG TPA: signal peptidase II [Caulobacteraceae bacterium]|nr:signal peptidase II [Caulobacteraceae bacterium]
MSRTVTRAGVFAYLLAVSIIVLDQLSKHWVLDVFRLPERGTVDVAGPFRLTFVPNVGVSFGFFGDGAEWVRWALSAFSLAVAIGLAVWARRLDRPLVGLSVGLVMGGAIGNLIDRVRFGWVVDFVDFQALRFPWVFNLADSAISVGVALLVLESLLSPKKEAAT